MTTRRPSVHALSSYPPRTPREHCSRGVVMCQDIAGTVLVTVAVTETGTETGTRSGTVTGTHRLTAWFKRHVPKTVFVLK